MPQFTLDLPHALGREEAMRRLKDKFAAAHQEYHDRVSNLREEWIDHTFSFAFQALGMGVSGTIAVEESVVRLAAQLPLAAMLFKGVIEERLRQEMGDLLAPTPASGG